MKMAAQTWPSTSGGKCRVGSRLAGTPGTERGVSVKVDSRRMAVRCADARAEAPVTKPDNSRGRSLATPRGVLQGAEHGFALYTKTTVQGSDVAELRPMDELRRSSVSAREDSKHAWICKNR